MAKRGAVLRTEREAGNDSVQMVLAAEDVRLAMPTARAPHLAVERAPAPPRGVWMMPCRRAFFVGVKPTRRWSVRRRLRR